MATDTALVKSGQILNGFSGLSIFRQVGLMLGFAACIAIGVSVVLWTKTPNYRPLYNNIQHLDAIAVSDVLQAEGIKFKIDTNTGVLAVDADKIHQARLKIAAAGLSVSSSAGYDFLAQDSSFGTSQFVEKARYHRTVELELAKTIASIQVVRSARVHLALPKRTAFVGSERKPSASVLVDLAAGQSLDKTQIAAIIHLIASSVPELPNDKVTVVDQRGNLLSGNDRGEDVNAAQEQFEYARKMEQMFVQRINNILTPLLGSDHFRVEVTADVDFARLEETAETYNPDATALRSEQVLDEQQNLNQLALGIPGALSNQPPAAAAVPEVIPEEGAGAEEEEAGESGNSRVQATRNFELDRTISYMKYATGEIKRLSVAVAIDDMVAADGKKTSDKERVPIPQEDLDRIILLVKDAIGFNSARGDTIKVINQPFKVAPPITIEPVAEQAFYKQGWFIDVIKGVLGAVVLGVIALGVLAPLLKSLIQVSEADTAQEGSRKELAPVLEEALPEEEEPDIGPEILLPGPEQSYEAQLNAIKTMVTEDPRRVAQVVKQWLVNSD